MTLPVARPLRAPSDRASAHQQQQQSPAGRRRTSCLGGGVAGGGAGGWSDAVKQTTQARRSWHLGYGALHDVEETTISAVAGAISGAVRRAEACKKGKVVENAILLDSPPKPRPTITRAHNAPRPPPLSFTHQPVVPTHASPLHPPSSPATESTTPGGGGFLSRLRRGRRNSGGGSGETDQLVKRNGQATGTVIKPAGSLASLRKCETVLALTSILRSSSSSSSIEPLQPQNRLRIAPEGSQSRLCSRCSSLLTLASGSRYSLDSAAGGFVRVPPTPDRLPPPILCKLCLVEVPAMSAVRIRQCECAFCSECMKAYVEFEISEGAYDISCPDAQCPAQGVLQQDEIKRLAGNDLLEKHKKYRLNREIELDKSRCWCPRAGCETVCSLCPSQPCSPQSVSCPTCSTDFCSSCKLEWHEGVTCEDHGKRLAKEGKAAPDAGIPFDSDLIKCCPMCGVPIEKDEGCAQMMCKRCKHVFCWYCLASLDDDFLLRHYDKGPCKNKLGHSRASVIWHRTQVIGIFAGFGILLLVASPLLLLAAPCIVCCKCRMCNAGTSKMDNEEDIQDES